MSPLGSVYSGRDLREIHCVPGETIPSNQKICLTLFFSYSASLDFKHTQFLLLVASRSKIWESPHWKSPCLQLSGSFWDFQCSFTSGHLFRFLPVEELFWKFGSVLFICLEGARKQFLAHILQPVSFVGFQINEGNNLFWSLFPSHALLLDHSFWSLQWYIFVLDISFELKFLCFQRFFQHPNPLLYYFLQKAIEGLRDVKSQSQVNPLSRQRAFRTKSGQNKGM